MKDDPRYEVRNREVEAKLKEIGQLVNGQLPEGWGFTLMLLKFSKPGEVGTDFFYMSSVQRDDMIRSMREFISRETRH